MARPLRTRSQTGDATRLSHLSLPDLSGDPCRLPAAAKTRAQHCGVSAPGAAHCNRGSAGIFRAQLLRQARAALHDLLSHAVSAIPALAAVGSAHGVLRAAALG